MKKNTRKLAIHKESLRNLTSPVHVVAAGTAPSICVGSTSEYTWYCPTNSACTHCPICEIN